jgi:hypothetical protein
MKIFVRDSIQMGGIDAFDNVYIFLFINIPYAMKRI